MVEARPGRDILSRSLRTSWLVAIVLAASLAPSLPRAALAILAGQLISFLNFIFLRQIVKLFTEGGRDARILLAIAAKVTLVYGGLAALIAWGGVRYAPLCAGIGLPFAALFLKSILLALGAGPSSLTARRATETARSLGNAAKPAVFLLLLGASALLAFSALPGPGTTRRPSATIQFPSRDSE